MKRIEQTGCASLLRLACLFRKPGAARLGILVTVFILALGTARADYTVSLLSSGVSSLAIRPGQSVDLDVMLISDNFDTHQSNSLRVTFSTPGSWLQSVTWMPPFAGGVAADRSNPAKSQLPLELKADVLSGPNLPPSGVDVQLANEASPNFDIPPLFGSGRLARLRILVPLDFHGPLLTSISADSFAFYQGTSLVKTAMGTPFQLKVTRDFSVWQQRNFVAGDQINSGADPDGDKFSNLMEYAFAMPPKSTADRDRLPTPIAGVDGWTLQYSRPTVAEDLDYRYEISTDLLTWREATAETDYLPFTNIPRTDGSSAIRIRLQPFEGKQVFARIRIIWSP